MSGVSGPSRVDGSPGLGIPGAPIHIVVDVFRAATTACHILSRRPADYFYTDSCAVVASLAEAHEHAVLVGRPETGSQQVYDIPNSPTRVADVEIEGRVLVHRTSAGAKGVLEAPRGACVLLSGFINATATARLVASLRLHEMREWGLGIVGCER